MNLLRRSILRFSALLLVIAVLSGCGPVTFTPEAAAVQAVTGSHVANFNVDPQSIVVTQSATVGETVIVQVKFSGVRPQSGREDCLGIFEVVKSRFGSWTAQGSGIGCAAGRPPVDEMPFSVGVTTFGGRQPNEPGYTIASGEVFDERVTTVRLTWADGTALDAPVANQTFMGIRMGEIPALNFDAVDQDGNIISSSSIGTAPGKQ